MGDGRRRGHAQLANLDTALEEALGQCPGQRLTGGPGVVADDDDVRTQLTSGGTAEGAHDRLGEHGVGPGTNSVGTEAQGHGGSGAMGPGDPERVADRR